MPSIYIDDDGTTTGVASDLTELLNLSSRTRISNIEPVNERLRRLFYFIRDRVSDDSLLAAFTRKWPCLWQANITCGPVLGPFKCRKEAIKAEINWVTERDLKW